MRDAVADAVEVVEGQLDLRLVRDGQQVQHGVGRAAEGHDDGDRVLERLARQDVARRDTAFEQPHHGFPGKVRVVVAAAVRGRRRGRPRHAHPHRLGRRRHRVRRVHAPAGAFTRADGAFDAVEVVGLQAAGPARADGFEGVDQRDVLLGAVGELHPAGGDRARVEEHRRQVEARGRHQHARQRLVAAGQQDRAVEAFGLHDSLDGVGDDLPRHEREVHPVVAHGDAVGHRDRAELQRVAAGRVHALLGRLRQPVEGQVARRDLVPRAGDADDRLVPVAVPHPDGAEHAAGGRGLDPVGHRAAAGFRIDRHRGPSGTTFGRTACYPRPRGPLAGTSRFPDPGEPAKTRRNDRHGGVGHGQRRPCGDPGRRRPSGAGADRGARPRPGQGRQGRGRARGRRRISGVAGDRRHRGRAGARPRAVVYAASGDVRLDDALADIVRAVGTGAVVVTPALYPLYDQRNAPAGAAGPGAGRDRGRAAARCSSPASTRAGATTCCRC